MIKESAFKKLNDANPNGVDQMVEVIENELEFFFENLFDNFPEFFIDEALAVGVYDDMTEEEMAYCPQWESEMLNLAIRKWQRKLARRVAEERNGD